MIEKNFTFDSERTSCSETGVIELRTRPKQTEFADDDMKVLRNNF